LLNGSEKMKFKIAEENEANAKMLLASTTVGSAWSPELGAAIQELWKDQAIQDTYSKRDSPENRESINFHLNDSAAYFFENIPRFIQPGYLPTVDDVLRARVRSTGIEEAEFRFQDLGFKMVDVGGQRSERRKWIHCFENVTAVIFCASLSEYDQYLREDDKVLRMVESLTLFDELCNSSYFAKTPVILFLNKTDLFKEKIAHVDLNVCFPNYTGGCTFETATTFIKQRFLEKNHQPRRDIYTHFTCAISTENVQFVFKCVRDTLIKDVIDKIIPTMDI